MRCTWTCQSRWGSRLGRLPKRPIDKVGHGEGGIRLGLPIRLHRSPRLVHTLRTVATSSSDFLALARPPSVQPDCLSACRHRSAPCTPGKLRVAALLLLQIGRATSRWKVLRRNPASLPFPAMGRVNGEDGGAYFPRKHSLSYVSVVLLPPLGNLFVSPCFVYDAKTQW